MTTIRQEHLKEVHKFYNDFHRKVKKRSTLYTNRSNDVLTVVLPAELLDYADAASGHSGFGSGARSIGIRFAGLTNAREARDRNFSSIENLIRFIEASPANREDMVRVGNSKQKVDDKTWNMIQSRKFTEAQVVDKLFKEYSSLVPKNMLQDFREDLYDVACGQCSIADLLADY